MARIGLFAGFAAFSLALIGSVEGQIGGAGGGNTGGGAGSGNAQNNSGIKIDSSGVMSLIAPNDVTSGLDKRRREAIAKKNLSKDLRRRSKLRFVSLVKLEREIERIIEDQKPIPDDLFFLAGLFRLEFVFVDVDEKDLIIGGPADGFVPDAIGRMIGIEIGRPTLRLDDLFVAMRTVGQNNQVGCSIDPAPQRLAELQKFLKQNEPATIDLVENRFRQMPEILGLQDVRIDGVPADSHFAAALVEADYRMKRIAIGLESPRVKGLKSYLASFGGAGSSMQRWWFVPRYESIARSKDGYSFRFAGPRARLLTEEEVADLEGNRSSAGTLNKPAQVFAKRFSEKFEELADNSPTFGELQSLIDWTVFAALLEHEQIPSQIEWKRDLFLDEARLKHPLFDAPQKVPSQVNFRRAGNMVVGQVCGGVVVLPQKTYDRSKVSVEDTDFTDSRNQLHGQSRESDHRWWWDANE